VCVAIVDCGALALGSALVAPNAISMAEVKEGVVMVIVVVAVGIPTVTGEVNGCLICREEKLRSSKSSDDLSSQRTSIPDGVTDTGT